VGRRGRPRRDLPNLQAEIDLERKEVENKRDADINARAVKLEADLAELEAEGAKADARRKVRDSAEREMAQLRKRSENEIERLELVGTGSRTSRSPTWRVTSCCTASCKDRYGNYFAGSMGASAIQKRLESFDLDAEAASLRETIRTGKGQRKTRALKRLKVVNAFLTTNNSPTGMVLDAVPVIPRTCVRWSSSTVAGSPPRT